MDLCNRTEIIELGLKSVVINLLKWGGVLKNTMYLWVVRGHQSNEFMKSSKEAIPYTDVLSSMGKVPIINTYISRNLKTTVFGKFSEFKNHIKNINSYSPVHRGL